VHTVVSFDFAAGIVPGWHATIFPPYFVAGAIYAGFAMVLTLAIPLRKIYGLQDFITMKHLDNMAKILLATGLIVAYGYAVEAFMAFYSGNTYERFMLWNRLGGPYKHMYWVLLFCNLVAPQMLWFRRVRRSIPTLFLMAMIVNLGMWLERYVIVVVSLHRDFLPSSWGMYHGTVFDWATFVGSIGLFLALMFLFIRLLPMISIFEMRQILPEAIAALLGMLALNGLPMPYHPVFNTPRFALASRDRFFLCIEARDPKFDHDETRAFLTNLGSSVVMDVEN
jgi:molybdopterin-containing oxidoreductase family membrane subunit